MQEYTPFFQGEKRNVTEKLAKYFEHSGLESKIHFDDEKLFYILLIPTDREKEARKLYQAFYFEERERISKLDNNEDKDSLEEYGESNVLSENLFDDNEVLLEYGVTVDADDETEAITGHGNEDEEDNHTSHDDEDNITDENESDEATPKLSSLLSGSGSYVMKSEKYNDYIGTFFVFLLLGVAGIVFVILNITEVLTFLNGLFPNFVMGALFLFFIYVGISTGIRAKNLKYEIEEEKQLTDKINQWLSKNVTDEFLKSISNEDLSEELDYIKKAETIRDMLINEFGDTNHDYLDRLIEDFYSKNFDNILE